MKNNTHIDNPVIAELEAAIDRLIENFTTLKAEHHTLQQAYNEALNEKDVIQQQHQVVKQKINSMINRLQTLE